MKKRFAALMLALALIAADISPVLAAAPKIRKTEYEGKGIVEVDFRSRKTSYKNAKVTVKDKDGKSLTAKILEKDGDDMSFKVKGLASGTKYSYTISGVRDGKTGKYGSVSGTFRTPSDKPEIQKVKYDRSDKELEVEFATLIQTKNLKVTVKDTAGKALTVRKCKKDQDELEIKVKGMVPGKTYTLTVAGVRVKGKGSYITVSKKFTA